MSRLTFPVPSRIMRVPFAIRHLTANLPTAIHDRVFLRSNVPDTTLARSVRSDKQSLRLRDLVGKTSLYAYGATAFRAVAKGAAAWSIGKVIFARKKIAAVITLINPKFAKAKWRVLEEFDLYLLSLFDSTILQDMDYISMETIIEEEQNE